MSDLPVSPLLETLRAAGGVTGEYHGQVLVRHFGDPHAEYEASTREAAVFDRGHRTRILVSGRSPGQMLKGILTGTVPVPGAPLREGILGGTGTYHAVLTPKGKMITDLWCFSLGVGEEEEFLLDVPVAGRRGLLEHLGRFLPPRFARTEDVTDSWGSLSVVGPDAAGLVARVVLGGCLDPQVLESLGEGGWVGRSEGGVPEIVGARTQEVWPAAYTLYGPAGALADLWREMVAGGAKPSGLGVWSTLRVEAGRPAFGTDMDEDTIPVEAGIHERAIDYTKGCYTGQEVIVRIRDRGHVNRSLRQLMLGDVPAPHRGAELFLEGQEKPVGFITSAVASPRYGQTVALAYVRRGVEGDPRPR